MNVQPSRHRWISVLPIAVALISLSGCQLLSKSQNPVTDTVVVGSPSLGFGTVGVGNSKTLANTLSNFKTTSVTISSVSGLTPDFQLNGIAFPLVLASGQQAQFSVLFRPNAPGKPSPTVTFIGDGGQSYASMALSGNAVALGQLSPNPASVAFGNMKVGKSQTDNVTLSNSGSTDLTISQATLAGTGFSMGNLVLPLTLHAGQSTTLSVTFAPPNGGNFSGSVAFTTAAAQAAAQRKLRVNAAAAAGGGADVVVLPLAGAGVTPGTLSASSASLAFGSIQVGKSANLSETLTNTGGSAVTISQANAAGAGFSISGLTLPATLNPNQSVSFTATFAPTAVGAASGSLSVVSDASNSPLNIAFSGTGLAAGSLTATPSSVSFGNVVLANNLSRSVTLTNTGGSSVTISSASASGAGFSFNGLNLPLTLTAGQGTTFNVVFAPTVAGSSTGAVVINSNAVNPTLDVALSGTGVTQGQITPNPASLSFGNVVIGGSKTLTETLTNSGGSSLTISAASASGTGYTISGLTLPLTLNAGQSTTFNVQFAPTAAGSASGNVSITSNGANPSLNIALSGAGVTPGTLSANPASLAFGTVQTGNSSNLSETLTNTGGSAVTITQANVTGAGYSVSGLTLPATLNPAQSVTFTATFAPSAAGAVNGNLAIISNASNSPLNIALSGTGVAPGQLAATPASLAFGSVQTGNSANLSETLTNKGGSAVTITQANVTGAGYSVSGLTLPTTLNPTQSVAFTVTFAPSAAGAVNGTLAIISNASNSPLNIALSGTGAAPGQLAASPASLAFGNVPVGSSLNLSETLSNSGGVAVTITQANVTGTGFSISGLTLPTTLNPTQSVTFTATFAPTAAGSASGTLAVISNASNSPLNVALSGTGTSPGQMGVSPATLNFGNVVVGANGALSGSLTATSASVTISSGSINSSEFALSGITFPKTLGAGQSAAFTVTFTPNATGAASGSLTFTSDAANAPTIEALTGNGQAPPPHSVDLTWNASTGAVGYNVYRRTPTGTYSSPINTTLISTTTDTDNTVAAGQTYSYVATAVDGNGVESGHSNEIQVVIPTP